MNEDDSGTPVMPRLWIGQMEKNERRQCRDLVAKIAASAVVHGRGADLLEYVYLAGLYHGTLAAKDWKQ